eukprot:15465807-Alexandrium_andersonii.AAC.1
MHMIDNMRRSRRSPKTHMTFGDEDFMGKVTRVASATHGLTTMLRTLQRYMTFMAKRMHKHRDNWAE